MNAIDIDRLADLTTRYARYSRSAGGLSLVVGGLLCFIAFAIGAAIELRPAHRYALAAVPLLWLLSKELLRTLYYQRQGSVQERLPPKLRRQHAWMVGYLFVVAALVLVPLLWESPDRALRWPGLGYVLVVAALPFVAMRWFWSVGDFLVGVLMFCQAAVVLAGGHYPARWLLVAAAFAAIAIAVGLREHRDFLRLRRDLGLAGADR